MERTFIAIGSLSAGLAVILGAFGAHALSGRLDAAMLAIFETGVRYQMYHALALVLVGLFLARETTGGLAVWAGWLFVAGTVLFSGSLYVLSLSGVRWLGAVTPLGGLAFIAGWLCLALAVLRS
jgi:uncharacterized membrane protein YgdD (TMEM256/DUF423 family)